MVKYIIRRVLLLIFVLIGVIALVFVFQALSKDDPARLIMGINATEEQVAAKRTELGLDKPVIIQFLDYLWNLIRHGSMGLSWATGQPVMKELLIRYPYTIKLALGSSAIGIILGIPLGVISAVKQYTFFDNAVLILSVFLSSFPNFWLALLMILLFAVKLGWLPASGVMVASGWILPILITSVQSMSNITRNTRSSMLETIRQDYIRTARAKGQKESKVVVSHALRNALIPVISSISICISAELGGTLIIENIFGIPGIGQYAIDAINGRNYNSVLGAVIMLAFTFSVINLIVDILYVYVDPRLRTTFAVKKKKKAVAE